MHIKKIRLVNFQSWDDRKQAMEFESDVPNFIKARNETGKSVVFKVFYEMCFPDYWGAKALVRRGKSVALMHIQMSDGTQVLYELYAKGARAYTLARPNQKPRKWHQYTIPDEIVQELGLIISYESRIILNVISKEIPLPYIETSGQYNATALQNIFEPAEVNKFITTCKDYADRIEKALTRIDRGRMYWNTKGSTLNFISEEELTVRRNELTRCSKLYKLLVDSHNALVDVNNLKDIKPVQVHYNVQANDINISKLSRLNSLTRQLHTLPSITKPDIVSEYAYNRVSVLLRILKLNITLHKQLALCNVYDKPDTPLSSNDNLTQMQLTLNNLKNISELNTLLHKLQLVKQPLKVSYTENQKLLDCLKVLTKDKKLLEMSTTLCKTILTIKDKKLECKTSIKNIQQELKICPTCGRSFNE